jgi:glycine/D-amino acid oxidase-like deaminating enzyme
MTNLKYDLIIVGGGPIGAGSAYFISQNKKELNLKNIALIQKEPEIYNGIAYPNAGGSIRWYFEDEEIKTNTKKTADFILSIKDKIDLNLIQDNYYFLHRGIIVPSLNISGKKLVEYFKNAAQINGVKIYSNTEFQKIEKENGIYKIITNQGEFFGERVIFALGHKNKEYFNLENIEIEKRQLFVLDLNLSPEQINLPHPILKFGSGIIFYFVKKFENGYKLVLGQEEIFEHNLNPEPENYFQNLIQMGLDEILPFLKNVQIEKILWGFDTTNKKPLINNYDKNVFIVNCGSAVRSLVGIIEELIKNLKNE